MSLPSHLVISTGSESDLLKKLTPFMQFVRIETAGAGHFHWFRGEPAEYGSCIPNIDRHTAIRRMSNASRVAFERDLMQEFRRCASGRLTRTEEIAMLPGSYQALPLELQIVMRHRGIPTRLLDWSHSPLVALFFACGIDIDTERSGEDGVIRWFNSQCCGSQKGQVCAEADKCRRGVVAENGWLPAFLDEGTSASSSEWVAFLSVADSAGRSLYPRIREQRGVFTFAGKPGIDHWTTLLAQCRERQNPEGVHYGTIVVKSSAKPFVRRVLADIWNITANSLFPDAEGVSIAVNNYFAQSLQQEVADTQNITKKSS